MSNNNTGHQPVRFRSVDGLRGLAALGVVAYHLSGNLRPELGELLPSWLMTGFSFGFLGVPIFFVISGFVISYGIGAAQIHSGYVGNFILRRSVRLDLTYWASIIMALILLALKNRILGTNEPMPTLGDVLLNMFYLQELMNVEPTISVVYWTLCLEVQLYLFYILSLWFVQSMVRNHADGWHTGLMLLLGVYSICLDLDITTMDMNGLFLSSWHYFLLGVLVSQAVRKTPFALSVLLAWLMIEAMFQLGWKLKANAVAGIGVTLSIYLLWRWNKMDSLLTGRVFSYLGAISYTLYLVHPDIGWKVISLGKYVLGGALTPMMAGVLFLVGVGASIVVAHGFHMLFEKPTLALAKRLKTHTLRQILKAFFDGLKGSRVG